MQHQHPLLDEIEGFLAESGMSPSYFGKKAAKNSELVARLRGGGDVRTATAERVRGFIREKSATENVK